MGDKSSPSGDSPLKQQMLKRNSLFGDELLNFDPSELEDDDNWRDVFDEPNQSGQQQEDELSEEGDSAFGSNARASGPAQKSASLAGAAAASMDKTSKLPAMSATITNPNKDNDGAPKSTSNTPPSVGEEKKEGNNKSYDESSGAPWHNAVVDKPHRDKMRLEIVQLLFARKKEKSSDEKWVARIKAQAGVFESQLYKNADSLDSYIDRTTLKLRIAKLANAFASHFKEAKRNSMRSSVSSMTSLGSLDANFANVDLRRASVESMVSGQMNLRESISSVASSGSGGSGPLLNNLTRPDSFRSLSSGSAMPTAMVGANLNNLMGNNMGGMAGSMGMQPQAQNNQQVQQQLLAMQQQQQRLLAQQMNMGGQGGGNPMLAAQAAMMGNNNMAMLQQMQQQSSMSMNMMQQQQNLMQQRQQNSMGINMMQNPNAALMLGNNGMNMMNINMSNVLSTGVGGMGNMQGINLMNNPMMGSRDSITMPPPGMMNASGMGQRPPGSSDDPNPLSPGSFNW